MEKISEKLKKEWEYVPLQPGEKRVYRLVGLKQDKNGQLICPALQGVVNQYVISDYKNDKNGVKEKVPKVIRYIIDQQPSANNPTGFEYVYGDIWFLGERNGTKILNGNNPMDVLLDEFLFFHHSNESNHGKEGHVRPRNGYTFRIVDNKNTASEKLTRHTQLRQAEDLIMDMADDDIQIFADQHLQKNIYGMSVEEIKADLLTWVRNPSNIPKVKIFSEDYNLKTKKEIRTALTLGIIKKSDNEKQVVWVDTGEPFHTLTPGRRLEESLVHFFSSESGENVHETMIIKTEEKKRQKKEPVAPQ